MDGSSGDSEPVAIHRHKHVGPKERSEVIRWTPIIPVVDTGPWHKSTIEPDYGRVPLEIGDGKR